MSPEALALAALVERQEIRLHRRAGLVPLAVVPLQRSELCDGRVDDLQQHGARLVLRTGHRRGEPALEQPLATPLYLAIGQASPQGGEWVRPLAIEREAGQDDGQDPLVVEILQRPPAQQTDGLDHLGRRPGAAPLGARRFSAQRSSSHRQPSAVDSRRLSSRAGSSGSSGPSRRSGSGRMPGFRPGSVGAGRSRRPRSATSCRRRRASSSGTAVIRSERISTWSQSARSSRQEWPTASRTRSSSKGLHGWRSAVQAARSCANSSGSSPGKISVRAVSPCLTAFMHERAFPFAVRGPHDRKAFRRLASTCRGVVIAVADLRTDLRVLHRILLPGLPSRHAADRAVPFALTALLYRTDAARSRPDCGKFSVIQDFGRSADVMDQVEHIDTRRGGRGSLAGFLAAHGSGGVRLEWPMTAWNTVSSSAWRVQEKAKRIRDWRTGCAGRIFDRQRSGHTGGGHETLRSCPRGHPPGRCEPCVLGQRVAQAPSTLPPDSRRGEPQHLHRPRTHRYSRC